MHLLLDSNWAFCAIVRGDIVVFDLSLFSGLGLCYLVVNSFEILPSTLGLPDGLEHGLIMYPMSLGVHILSNWAP